MLDFHALEQTFGEKNLVVIFVVPGATAVTVPPTLTVAIFSSSVDQLQSTGRSRSEPSAGATAILDKPFTHEDLLAAIYVAIGTRRS